jgi:hypothetical protein
MLLNNLFNLKKYLYIVFNMNDDGKVYRVYKLWSINTDKFYVGYTKSESYLSMVLQGMISRYKQSCGDLKKYKKYFYILSKDGLKIEELKRFESGKEDEMREYLSEMYNNPNCINMVDVEYDYKFNKDITCKKEKVDKKKYLKEYYVNNKDKYKDRYIKNRDEILTSKKESYKINKKGIE